MKRRIRRLAQQWATAANRLDAKLEERWRDQKKVRDGGISGKKGVSGVFILLTLIRYCNNGAAEQNLAITTG